MISRSFHGLRSGNKNQSISFVRNFSRLLTKDPNDITVSELQSIQQELEQQETQSDDTNSRISLLAKISNSNNLEKQSLVNEIIPSFSLFFKLSKHEDNVITTNEILSRLIEINPGRVHSSWDLFKQYENGLIRGVSPELVNQLLRKLIHGENYEQQNQEEDEKYVISLENCQKIDYLLKTHVESHEYVKDSISSLVDTLIENDLLIYLTLLIKNNQLKIFNSQVIQDFLNKDTVADVSYLTLFQILFQQDPKLLSKQQLVEALNILERHSVDFFMVHNKKQQKLIEGTKHESSIDLSLDPKQLELDIVSYIETNHLDLDKTPESLLIRLKLIEYYGIEVNNLDKTLKKFHTYQTHEKFGIEFIQINLVKSFIYQSFDQNDETFLKVGETLIPQDDQIAVKVLQMLIIGHSSFNDEASLKLYNDYIQKVPKQINIHTKRSPAGLLTESLIVANLYNNDRNFAQLILDKAIENSILHDEFEITHIKTWLKKYGESFVDDDNWSLAKPIFKSHILKYVKLL
ncbi:hypothetical protein DFJ63DRAFT_332838 [Scheffersomyces coipomensis]|uniref:uncharacterized protein n=1 Tax=Scheffersomyces coipomensis TaxID=1788519 RepID=UPI00315D992D